MNILSIHQPEDKKLFNFSIAAYVVDLFTQQAGSCYDKNGKELEIEMIDLEPVYTEFGVTFENNQLFFVWAQILTSDEKTVSIRSKTVRIQDIDRAIHETMDAAGKLCAQYHNKMNE